MRSLKKILLLLLFMHSIQCFSSSTQQHLNFEPVLVGGFVPLLIDPETKKLFGSVENNKLQSLKNFADMGLSNLRKNRDYRMSILTKLSDHPKIRNLVSNTYGDGCLVIYEEYINGAEYKFSEVSPVFLDRSGNPIDCIKSLGETIVSADFDNDGMLDLLLPYYERTYLFKNNGNYVFQDVAPDYISLVDYMPRVEGAAIVDLFGSGCLDILIGPTVAKGDCNGGFKRIDVPESYKIPDEGLLVRDLDNDGFYEIVKIEPNESKIYIYKVKANNVISFYKAILLNETGKVHSTFGIDAHDLFAKGCDDIIVAGGQPVGNLPYIVENDCKGAFKVKKLGQAPGIFQTTVMAEDINGDGRVDIVAPVVPSIGIAPQFSGQNFDKNLIIPSLRSTYLFFNKNKMPLNFRLGLLKNKSLYAASGRSLMIEGRDGSKKLIQSEIGSGYLTQKSISPLLYLNKSNCPYKINVLGSDANFVLSCDSIISQRFVQDEFDLAVDGSFDKSPSDLNLISPLGSSFWNRLDNAIVLDAPVGVRLANGNTSWARIRTLINIQDKCNRRFELLVKGFGDSTNLITQINDKSGSVLIRPTSVNGLLRRTFETDSEYLVLDFYNEDPIIEHSSIIENAYLLCN